MFSVRIAILSSLLLRCSSQHIPTVMLKQAAEELLETSFISQQRQQSSGLARIDIPAAEDLLIRRLQGELTLRIEDTWLSINDPQRWAILNAKPNGPEVQILKSFTSIKICNILTILKDTLIIFYCPKTLELISYTVSY